MCTPSFRKATPNDIPFLWDLRQLTMKPHVKKSYGWNENVQFNYAKQDLSSANIVMCGAEPIGVLKVLRHEHEFFLSQIQVHPHWAGKGIGHKLLTRLIHEAIEKQKTIRLEVLKVNPALRLYKAFGFEIQREMAFEYEMLWRNQKV
jgi:ribosomal protein S18 acetylase RimI-like enzyme